MGCSGLTERASAILLQLSIYLFLKNVFAVFQMSSNAVIPNEFNQLLTVSSANNSAKEMDEPLLELI